MVGGQGSSMRSYYRLSTLCVMASTMTRGGQSKVIGHKTSKERAGGGAYRRGIQGTNTRRAELYRRAVITTSKDIQKASLTGNP